MAYFVTNKNHLTIDGSILDLPKAAWDFRNFLTKIIIAGTARPNLVEFISGLPCRKKIKRKPCTGTIKIARQNLPMAQIHWACTQCEDGGVVTGFGTNNFDQVTPIQSEENKAEKFLEINLTTDEFSALLHDSNCFDPDSEKIIFAAEKNSSGVQISGFEGDIENLIGYIASNANNSEVKKIRKPLDSAFVKIQNELDLAFESSHEIH